MVVDPESFQPGAMALASSDFLPPISFFFRLLFFLLVYLGKKKTTSFSFSCSALQVEVVIDVLDSDIYSQVDSG